MKKDLFIIQTHSIVDVITNSSTELYCCDTEKTVNEVEDLIKTLLTCHSDRYSDSEKECTTIDQVLTVESQKVSEFLKDISDWEESYEWEFKKLKEYNPNLEIIRIESCDCHSTIPYWIMQFIEDQLNGIHFHLG